MKQIHIMFALVLMLASANTAAAVLIKEAYEIPFQINESDRIIVGTVTDVQSFSYHTIVTIEVVEWLKNPTPKNLITVQTDVGTIDTGIESDEASFTVNESMILMLKDVNINENRFAVVFGQPGKHPLSDRDAVLQELAARERALIEGNSEDKIVDYPPSPVEFIVPTFDHGLDMDGDGLYDYLILELNARTTAPGWYRFTGDLYVPLGTYEENGETVARFQTIEFTSMIVYLNETVQVVAINFEGGRIRDNQINGPYEVSILMNTEKWDFGNVLDCTTSGYDYTEFEQPVLLLSGPVRLKADAIGLARQKAAEIGVTVGEVNHTEIITGYSDELWALEFKGETFDERFVVYGNTTDEIVHWTMDATLKREPGIPFMGATGTLMILIGTVLFVHYRKHL
ncbi:MAG: hypothetical protein K0A89_01105 [ANME-2 cluster archaeon]|nr:hypothetical protein [ANME-2 cluster archaeon]